MNRRTADPRRSSADGSRATFPCEPSAIPLANRQPTPRSKYGNVRVEVEVDGKLEKFDSKAERDRYLMLRILQRAGAIDGLRRQWTVDLIVEGDLIGKMRWDFVYSEAGQVIFDDTKGKATPEWMVKARVCRALFKHVEHRINGVMMS